MWLRFGFLAALAVLPAQAVQTPPSAQVPAASPSARVAAVHFAIANGWQFPTTNLVVAEETVFFVMHGRPIDRSVDEQKRYSAEIARLIGSGVKADWTVGRTLDCPADPPMRPCWAKANVSVLYVSEVLVGASSVALELFLPGKPGEQPATTQAAVMLERRGEEWVGVKYGIAPRTMVRR